MWDIAVLWKKCSIPSEQECSIGADGVITVVGRTPVCVPWIIAGGPGQLTGERPGQVIQDPGDDYVVVDAEDAWYHHHTPANSYTNDEYQKWFHK